MKTIRGKLVSIKKFDGYGSLVLEVGSHKSSFKALSSDLDELKNYIGKMIEITVLESNLLLHWKII